MREKSKALWLWVFAQQWCCGSGLAAGVLQMGGRGQASVIPGLEFNPCWRMEKPGSEEGMRLRSQMPEGKVLWNSSPQRYCYTLGHPRKALLLTPNPAALPRFETAG